MPWDYSASYAQNIEDGNSDPGTQPSTPAPGFTAGGTALPVKPPSQNTDEGWTSGGMVGRPDVPGGVLGQALAMPAPDLGAVVDPPKQDDLFITVAKQFVQNLVAGGLPIDRVLQILSVTPTMVRLLVLSVFHPQTLKAEGFSDRDIDLLATAMRTGSMQAGVSSRFQTVDTATGAVMSSTTPLYKGMPITGMGDLAKLSAVTAGVSGVVGLGTWGVKEVINELGKKQQFTGYQPVQYPSGLVGVSGGAPVQVGSSSGGVVLPQGDFPNQIFDDFRFICLDYLTGKFFPSDEIEPINWDRYGNDIRPARWLCYDRMSGKSYYANRIRKVRVEL